MDGSKLETTSVMFVDQTPYGELTKRLQLCEDRVITGRRVKMVEMGGSQLSQLLPNTNPWARAGYIRLDCHTCQQGGTQERKEDCFRRNILFECRCGRCEDRQGGEPKRKRQRKDDKKIEGKNIYVGETARSLYERTKEHIRDGRNETPDSHIAKHWEECHAGEDMPEFRFKIVRSFQYSLGVSELTSGRKCLTARQYTAGTDFQGWK